MWLEQIITNNKKIHKSYFLGSVRSTDNFLVFANCSTAGGARLFPDDDWMNSGSVYDCAAAFEIPWIFKLEGTWVYSTMVILASW